MSGQIWEVVGGGEKGGIVVREGKDLKSKELARLRTGSLVRQLELAGDRLSFERLSGAGPGTGWASLQFKGSDLLVKSDKEPPPAPVLACFYSGGMTAPQGRNQLKALLEVMKAAGIKETVIMDHIGEKGFEDCKDFEDYISRLAAALDDPKFEGRPVFIVAHSHGSVPAWGLAKRLGERCLKLYVLTRRPPNGALLDEVWGVDSAPKLDSLEEEFVLKNMVAAWPNKFLDQFKNNSPLPKMAIDCMKVVKRQYSSPVFPSGSADAPGICGEGQAVAAPIMALAAELEAEPKGETASKMEGWKDFTAGGFELVTVPGVDHMGIIQKGTPAFDLILNDMQKLML